MYITGAGITIEELVNRAGNDNLKDKVWNLISAWLTDKKVSFFILLKNMAGDKITLFYL